MKDLCGESENDCPGPQGQLSSWVRLSDENGRVRSSSGRATQPQLTNLARARHAPAATPAGEGVYAITTTGRESHLSYILTVPSEISEVQKELGLRQRASFVTSVKNPTVGGPANAQLPNPAKFDQEWVALLTSESRFFLLTSL